MDTKDNKTDPDSDVESLKIRIGRRGRVVDSRPTTPRSFSHSRTRDADSDYDSDVESGKKSRKNITSPSSNEPTNVETKSSDSTKNRPNPAKKQDDSSSSEEPVTKKVKPVSQKKKPENSSSSSSEEVKKKPTKKGRSASASPKKKQTESSSSSSEKKKPTKKKAASSSSDGSSKKKKNTKKKAASSSSSSDSGSSKKKKNTKKKKAASSSSSSDSGSSKKSKKTRKPKKDIDEEQLKKAYTMKISSSAEKFTLADIQKEHLARNKEILLTNKFLLDNSELGSGKTITAMALIEEFINGELNPEGYTKKPKYVVYITYSRLIPKVQALFKKYGFKNTCLVSFETIRSNTVKEKKGKVLSHGLLSRQDYGVEKKSDKFSVTEMYQEMVKRGCLLILDEVQALSGASLQYHAAKTLERYIIDGDNPSYVVEMTGSPTDKIEQLLRSMYRFGLSKEDNLYTAQFGDYKPTGIKEIIKKAKQYDEDKAVEILHEYGINRKGKGLNNKNTKDVGYALYKGLIQDHISHAMPKPKPRPGVETKISNTFFRASDEDYKSISAEVKGLIKNTKFNPKTGKFEEKDGKKLLSAIGKGMKRVETSMSNIFIRKAKEILKENENAKLVIALNNKLNIRNIADALIKKKYKVIIIWGKDPETGKILKGPERQALVDKFNQENNKYRVLIGVMKIISTGFDLDDKSKDGIFPRTALASPTHSMNDTHQFTGRFIRGYDTSSASEVKYVYAETRGSTGENMQLKMLDSMARKGEIAKSTSKTAVENGTIFPGSYPQEEEEGEEDIPDGPLDIADILESIGYDDETDDEDEAVRIAMEQEENGEGEDSDSGKKKSKKKKPAKKPSKKKPSSPENKKKKSSKKKKDNSSSSPSFGGHESLLDSDSD